MTSKDHDPQSPGANSADSDRPVVSVSIVSGYLGGQTNAWDDLRWYQVPLSIALGAVVHGLELPGTLRAVNGRDTGVTVYR
jgi:hypothetical protein